MGVVCHIVHNDHRIKHFARHIDVRLLVLQGYYDSLLWIKFRLNFMSTQSHVQHGTEEIQQIETLSNMYTVVNNCCIQL